MGLSVFCFKHCASESVYAALKSSKGVGNFRNLFFRSPNGKTDCTQRLLISEPAAKNAFFNIKNVSRDDQLTAHLKQSPALRGFPFWDVDASTHDESVITPAA